MYERKSPTQKCIVIASAKIIHNKLHNKVYIFLFADAMQKVLHCIYHTMSKFYEPGPVV